MNHVHLANVDLVGADLREAYLKGAILWEADLTGADLREAYLENAKITDEQLSQAKSLDGATMPDGTKYDGRYDKEEGEQ